MTLWSPIEDWASEKRFAGYGTIYCLFLPAMAQFTLFFAGYGTNLFNESKNINNYLINILAFK